MGEDAASSRIRDQFDAREAAAVWAWQAIVMGQAHVEHGPVGLDDFTQGQVLSKHLLEVGNGFCNHAFFQPRIIFWIKLRIRLEHANAMQLQPLLGKGRKKAFDLWITDHPIQLSG